MKPAQCRLPLVLFLAATVMGCGSDTTTLPTEPILGSQSKTTLPIEGLASGGARRGGPHSVRTLWPNADGNSWTFDYQRHLGPPMIPALEGLESVPPEELDYRDLEQRLLMELPAPFPNDDPLVGNVLMAFNGLISTPYAGQKQRLDTDFSPTAKVRTAEPAPLLRRIYLARPDLRAKMVAKGLVPQDYSPGEAVTNIGPILINPGLEYHYFEQQDSWMGYYGDLNPDSSFTVLQAPLTPGSSFRHQLVPDLADDIWEYGWIVGKRHVETPGGEFRHALRAVYFFDFGWSYWIDEHGEIQGEFRSFSIAMLNLAPDVGPVWQRCLDFLAPPIPELNIESGVYFDDMRLLGFGASGGVPPEQP